MSRQLIERKINAVKNLKKKNLQGIDSHNVRVEKKNIETQNENRKWKHIKYVIEKKQKCFMVDDRG